MTTILKIVPPVWLLLFLFTALLLHNLLPETRVFDFPLPITGLLLALCGVALNVGAARLFRKEGTEILPTSPGNRVLVTHGTFRFSRNPMYLGMVLVLLGIAFYIGSLPMFVAALAQFLVLNFVFIPFEENKMARQFTGQYAAYKMKVRRWL